MEEKIELIIFDCDGVLVDSESIQIKTFEKVLPEIDFIKMVNSNKFPKGAKFSEIQRAIEFYFKINLGLDFEENFRKAFYKELKKVKAIDGVEEVLKTIKIKKVVLTNGPVEKVENSLKTTRLKKYFDKVYSAYQLGVWKPDPNIYVKVAKDCGIKLDNVLVIEDSEIGAVAALKAGMKVIGFDQGYHFSKGTISSLTHIHANMNEVLETLKKYR